MALNGRAIREGSLGVPVFDEAIAWMECRVTQAVDCGTHTLFLGEMAEAGINNDEAVPASMSDTRMKYGGVRRGGH